MTKHLATLFFAVLLFAAAVGVWFLGASEMVGAFQTADFSRLSIGNVIAGCLFVAVVILALLGRHNDRQKNHPSQY